MARNSASAWAIGGRALARNAWAALALAFLIAAPPAARAQDVSAEDQQGASAMYDRATAAYVSRNYDQAASLFETAHRLAPAAAALVQAVRSHERAGHALRAATLALQLQALYPDDRAAARTARSALEAADRFARVEVSCEGCRILVDGALVEHPVFFVEPGAAHTVVGAFDTGEVQESLTAEAGETRALRFEAPPPPPAPEPGDPIETEPDPALQPPAEPVDGGGGGVPAWLTIGALVITAALGGVLVWSGLDALDGVPAYEAMPTPERLSDGRMREERTNWLIGGTALAGAATLILAIFTDWTFGAGPGGGDQAAEALLDVGPERLVLGARGRF